MLNEIAKVFDNVSIFRRLLTESVSQSIIIDAIKDMEYLYLYYKGDGVESTGYRTIKPFVLGVRKSKKDVKGNTTDQEKNVMVLRGWQIEGDSDSKVTRGRSGHEKFRDNNLNKEVPGWREFRIDRIISAYPTGNTFKTDELPKPYKGDLDKVIFSIKASIPKTHKRTEKVSVDKRVEEIIKSPRFNKYVEDWYNTVKKIKKRSPAKNFVYVNKKGNFAFATESGLKKYNIPKERVVGNLLELYNEYVLPDIKKSSRFFERKKRSAQRHIKK